MATLSLDQFKMKLSNATLQRRYEEIVTQNEDFYSEYLRDLDQKSGQLTPTEIRYALETILAIATVDRDKAFIAQISNEDQRNQYVTDLTGVIAERELIPGSDPTEIEKQIAFRVNELKEAFRFDQSKDDTTTFYRSAFKGPPCFNGRIITLEEYVAEKQKLIPKEEIRDNRPWDKQSVQLEAIMYEFLGKNSQEPQDKPPSLKTIQRYTDHVYPTLFDAGQFQEIYNRAREFFLLNN